jgi:D-beta-D-heptose 7-phosphate kinase/D-beta-D-heptose 1-phosphate adenosyltransferase
MPDSIDNQPIALIAGCFDGVAGLHDGHRHILTEMRKLAPEGTYIVVALNSDSYVSRKGPGRPLTPFTERKEALYASGLVDEVFPIEDTPIDIIRMLEPKYIVVGDDYTVDRVVGAEEAKSWGGSVVIIPRIPGHSTSELITLQPQSRFIVGMEVDERGNGQSVTVLENNNVTTHRLETVLEEGIV